MGSQSKDKEGENPSPSCCHRKSPRFSRIPSQKGAKSLSDKWGLTPLSLTKFLNQKNALVQEEDRSILVYRNRDEKTFPMPIKEFEERLEMTYSDSLIFDSSEMIYKVAKNAPER